MKLWKDFDEVRGGRMEVARLWEAILHRLYLLLLGLTIVAAAAYFWASHQPVQYKAVANVIVVPHLGNKLSAAQYSYTVKVAQEYESAPLPSTVLPTLQSQLTSRSIGQLQNELRLGTVANQPVISVTVTDHNAVTAVGLAHSTAFLLANAYTQQAVKVNTTYSDEVQSLQTQAASLANQLAAAQVAAEQQGPNSPAATLLTKLQSEYVTISSKLTSTQAAWSAHPLVYFAVSADASSATRTGLSPQIIALFGAAAGLFAGIGFAFLFDFLESTVRTPQDIARFTKLKTLGTVRAVTLVDDPQAVMRPDEYAAVAPSYEELARNIRFLGVGRRLQTVLVCPTARTPNSDLFVANVAITLAQMSLPSLLIDLNYQRPMVQTRFALPDSRHGIFTALLQASVTPGQSFTPVLSFAGIVPSPVAGLDLLPLGPLPPNPGDLLRASMDRLWAELRTQYHYIIVLAPQTLNSAGGRELVDSVDGTIVVATAGMTRRSELAKHAESLQRLQANVIGAAIITSKRRKEKPVRKSTDLSNKSSAPPRNSPGKLSASAQAPNMPVAASVQKDGRRGARTGSQL